MNKMLWYNDADIWYNFSDWVVAESPEECNKILSEKEGVSLDKILERKYTWTEYKAVVSDSRYLGFSKLPLEPC